jgi:hypothetical protein
MAAMEPGESDSAPLSGTNEETEENTADRTNEKAQGSSQLGEDAVASVVQPTNDKGKEKIDEGKGGDGESAPDARSVAYVCLALQSRGWYFFCNCASGS